MEAPNSVSHPVDARCCGDALQIDIQGVCVAVLETRL